MSRATVHRLIAPARRFMTSCVLRTCGTSKSGMRYSYYRCPDCRRNARQDAVERTAAGHVRAVVEDPEVRALIAGLMEESERSDAGPRRSEGIRRELFEIERAYGRIWQAIE